MSFPRYENYKDSGISWLGEIPSHWQARRAKFLFDRKQRPVSDDDNIVTAFRDGQVTLRKNRREDGFTVALKEIGYQGVRQGDLVIHAMDAFAGAVGVSDSDGKCSPVYSCCEPKEKVLAPFYGYLVRTMALAGFIESLAKGVRERSTDFRWGDFSSLELPLPPVNEQEQAVSFIANETGKIDALVAEQEKLIGLLKEKRQAVISHAVTKGLDPNARMKDSGVEWLGEVPDGWEVKRIKYLLVLLTDYTANGSFASLAENVNYLSEGYSRLVRLTDLRENLENEGIYVDEKAHNYLKKSELFGGEILIANVGAYAGYACVMPHEKGTATLGPNMYLMNFDEILTSNDFVLTCLNSDSLQEQLKLAATSTAQPKLNKDNVKECSLTLPPKIEQEKILNYVNKEKAKIDALIEEAQKAIELMKERRTALISAAVTGKIDVRGYCPAKEEEAV